MLNENACIETPNCFHVKPPQYSQPPLHTNFQQFEPSTMTDAEPQSVTLSKLLPGPFQIVNSDVLCEIFLSFKVEDLKVLHTVCRSFHAITALYLTYTTMHISDKSELETDFIKFCKFGREFAHPFLYQQTVIVKREQFSKHFKAEYPILAIFTAYDIFPK
jgi:hypothetical protein